MNKSALLLLLLIGLLVLTETTTAWWGRRRRHVTAYDQQEIPEMNEIPDMESEDGFTWSLRG
uniref:Uncharacterized LOC100180739 n=1 Tax=Ciona intestinalis TaxID=7719 RepID=F6SQ14_CIOIN